MIEPATMSLNQPLRDSKKTAQGWDTWDTSQDLEINPYQREKSNMKNKVKIPTLQLNQDLPMMLSISITHSKRLYEYLRGPSTTANSKVVTTPTRVKIGVHWLGGDITWEIITKVPRRFLAQYCKQ